MEMKTFEKTFKICSTSDHNTLYDELENQIFYSVVENLPNADTYNEIMAMREAYDNETLDFNLLSATIPHLTIEGVNVTQKAIRYYLRYLQITHSLFGINGLIGEELSHDFHIFGSVTRGPKIMPYIPDNSKCLLMDSNVIKSAVWEVVRGKDPIESLRKAYFIQPVDSSVTIGTVAFNFHMMAMLYISLRSSMRLQAEKNQIKITPSVRGNVLNLEHMNFDNEGAELSNKNM
ncbi:P6 [Emaravirus kiwii]|uniref:P6 n=1 Tax=Emaravirus kiwii TaxID=2660760 RepID=A0A5Q5AR51_9VIRU|nr:P6 [Emaravirus kiwii]QEE82891.1 P6 [Emaravirus kiwii]